MKTTKPDYGLNEIEFAIFYILPCYNVLHTQGKDYIVNDIIELMKRKGVEERSDKV